MSRFWMFGRYELAPKKPPPERGIRMKKAGVTWWGQRWIEALQSVLSGDSARLARGKTYARAGRVHDLVVKGGTVTAKVTGSRPTPYKITLKIAQLGEAAWKKAISVMAEKAQFSAELLADQMPREIDEAFRASGVSLFPAARADLETSCSCPDWGDPCKHVAATHYVLGEALDRDPFLLFDLRGKSKSQVLDALRAARGKADEPPKSEPPKRGRKGRTARGTPEVSAAAAEVPSVVLGKIGAADYDRPREILAPLRFDFGEPVVRGAVLRQLGAPAGWEGAVSPAEVLAPLVHAAADTARQIAMSVTSEEAAEVEAAPSLETASTGGRARTSRAGGAALAISPSKRTRR